MNEIGVALLAMAAATASPSGEPAQAATVTLADLDRTFVCPENLPDAAARDTALKTFMKQVVAAKPDLTLQGFAEFRLSLLHSHACRQTLANVTRAYEADLEQVPPPSDHWLDLGHGSGPGFGIDVRVDADSLVDAGPGRMRAWIRYRNDAPNDADVKETLAYEQLNCPRAFHSAILLYGYDAAGRVVVDERRRPEDEERIVPGSFLAQVLPLTCAALGLQTH